MSKTTRYSATASIAAMFVLSIAATVPSQATPDLEPLSNHQDASDLLNLASILNALPGATAAVLAQGSPDTPECGTTGHCNQVQCAEPECEDGSEPTCKCEANGQKCEDHCNLLGFDCDVHPVYDCTCSCSQPKEECALYDPLKGDCLLPEEGLGASQE